MKTTKSPEPVARLLGVSKVFGQGPNKTQVLKNISFEAYPGELLLLLGPSGSGKSTFLTLLAGLQAPSEGEVWLFGRKVQDFSTSDLQSLRARHLGFIFQTFHLIDSLTALENILLVMKFTNTPKRQAKAQALELLDRFAISHLTHIRPPTMSQGEKQRVAIARALANHAELIIADEPTGNLDSNQGMEIAGLLRQIAEHENRCVVLTSHDPRIIGYANRVFYLQDGKIRTKA